MTEPPEQVGRARASVYRLADCERSELVPVGVGTSSGLSGCVKPAALRGARLAHAMLGLARLLSVERGRRKQSAARRWEQQPVLGRLGVLDQVGLQSREQASGHGDRAAGRVGLRGALDAAPDAAIALRPRDRSSDDQRRADQFTVVLSPQFEVRPAQCGELAEPHAGVGRKQNGEPALGQHMGRDRHNFLAGESRHLAAGGRASLALILRRERVAGLRLINSPSTARFSTARSRSETYSR